MPTVINENIRNIAIIAHVDHGKTTLVDHLIKQGEFETRKIADDDRVMDSGDIEKERGITITAKNCSTIYDGIKYNILDTPGHADFGGEVERALMMVDGAILLVDAAEGPLPQSRFVLQKALELNLKIIVCINKIDRSDQRAEEVLNEIYDLFFDLDAKDHQIEFPVLYLIAKDGIAKTSMEDPNTDLKPLFAEIKKTIPGPSHDPEEPFQMLVANISYSDYLGQLAIGKVMHGKTLANQQLVKIDKDSAETKLKVVKIQSYDGVNIVPIEETEAGNIIIIAGMDSVEIGDTITSLDSPKALPRIEVEPPTISMRFSVNTSPFAGKEGDLVQSQKIAARLKKETLYNVGIKIEALPDESFMVKGRGEFQLAILIETMRREGFELSVGRPEVILKEENGKKLEPIEHVFVDCNEDHLGIISEKLSTRKGKMTNLINHGSGRIRVEFSIPSRGLVGYRNQFLTDTKGTGILSSYLASYEEYRGDFDSRISGSLVSDRQGNAITFGLFNLEQRGKLFVTHNDPVYEGMIIGENSRAQDLNVNPTKTKKLSNMRASGKDESLILTPISPMTIERALEFIKDDELVEVTPLNVRLRKKILDATKRKRS